MRFISILIVVSLLAFASSGRCEGPTSEIPSDLILERFTVPKNGDFRLVPVRFTGKDYLFVVDTGSTRSFFDASLPLGQPVDELTAEGTEGQVEGKWYRPPDAKVGRIALGLVDSVPGIDLKSIRQVSGHPIQGMLGMDFLGRYVVHIDIERGEVLLLRSAPMSAGVELPLSWEPDDHPYVSAEFVPGERIRFAIDTGACGPGSGTLGLLETTSLERKGDFRVIGKSLAESISGSSSHLLFQGSTLNIGGFDVHSPIFSESHGKRPNRLGLTFCSRFAVTFDFPKRKVYLRKSAYFGRPDRWNATGLHLLMQENSVKVAAVDPDSPAARAGFKKGDILVELNGLQADKTALFDLHSALCNGGQLTCVVRRDSQARRLSIDKAR